MQDGAKDDVTGKGAGNSETGKECFVEIDANNNNIRMNYFVKKNTVIQEIIRC